MNTERPKSCEILPSEALFMFAGMLTSRKEKTVMSSTDDCAHIATIVNDFCKEYNLSPPREHFGHPLNVHDKRKEKLLMNPVFKKLYLDEIEIHKKRVEEEIFEEFYNTVITGNGRGYSTDKENQSHFCDFCNKENIIYKNITIGRVLALMGNQYCIDGDGNIYHIEGRITLSNNHVIMMIGINWKLLNEDGSQCTFDNQDIDTIKSILKILQN